MTWEEVKAKIVFWDNTKSWGRVPGLELTDPTSGFEELITTTLQNFFNTSSKARELLIDAVNSRGEIRIGSYPGNNAFAVEDSAGDYIGLNRDFILDLKYFNDRGEIVDEIFGITLIHELIHYAYRHSDDPEAPSFTGQNDSDYDFKGHTVRLQNEISRQMGITHADNIQAAYHAGFMPPSFSGLNEFTQGYSYSAGQTIDVALVGRFLDDVLDTSNRTDDLRDLLFGLDGADEIRSGLGNDFLYGGDGDDVIEGGAGEDLINGEDGADEASYVTSNAGVTVNLTTGLGSGGHAEGDFLRDIEILRGSSFNDTFTGDVHDTIFHGGGGWDTVNYSYAEAGDFYGLAFFNSPELGLVITPNGSGDTDYLMGVEVIEFSGYADHVVLAGIPIDLGYMVTIDGLGDGTGPKDTLDLRILSSGVNLIAGILVGHRMQILNFEILYLGEGADVVSYVVPNARIFLGGGGDQLQAAGEGATVFGGAGGDYLTGGAGTQILVGSDDAETDTLTGGEGGDWFVAGNGDIITDASAADRLMNGSSGVITGEATRDEGSIGPYTNAQGHTFAWDGDDLIVTANGKTVKILDFEDGDLGITLKERDDDDDDEPGDDDGPGGGGSPFPTGPFLNPPASPLVFDLDGDGLEITALAGSGVHFDLDASGSRERTGWLNGDDGFLVLDANANGRIDDGHELFGNTADNGFDVLSFYDGRIGGNYYTDPAGGTLDLPSYDGIIDSNDAIWSSLQIWRDLDQDGVSDAGELFSLSSLGIQSINLSYSNVNVSVHEHSINQTSTAQTTGGTMEISDVWFVTDRIDTVFDYDPEVIGFQGWPDLHAAGDLRSLRHAMHLDTDLAEAVANFIRDAENLSLDGLQQRFTEVLLTWAGVEDNPLTGRGLYFPDARILEFLEQVHDRDYRQLEGMNAGTNNPGPGATAMLLEAFEIARDTLMLQFLSQIPQHHLAQTLGEGAADFVVSRFSGLWPALSYDPETGRHAFDPVLLTHGLGELDPTSAESVRGLMDTLDFLPALGRMLDMEPEDFLASLHLAFQEAGRPELRVFADWYLARAAEGATPPRGGVRVATEGQELSGSGTSDLIVIGAGVGTVTLQADDSADRILLTGAFAAAEWTAARDSVTGDLTVTFTGLGVTLVLEGYFLGTSGRLVNAADVLYFPDGRVVGLSEFREAAIGDGSSGDDVLIGSVFDETFEGLAGADEIRGGGGADVLRGGDGDDTLIGGAGDDVIEGGAGADVMGGEGAEAGGADTYIFRAGDGHDVLSEIGTNARNTVRLEDTDPEDLLLAWSGADLVLTFVGRPGDSVTLVDFRNAETVSTFRFAGGQTWTYRQLVNEALLQDSSPGDDVLVGTSGRDVLVGGLGNDEIRGASSSFNEGDVFLYRQGDGDDVLHANYSYSNDELILTGINAADVTVTRSGNDAVLSFAGGGSITLHDQFDTLGWNVLERIVFDDGSVWSERDIAFAVQPVPGAPTTLGTSGADTLNGTSGRDSFDGGAGDDILRGGDGSDTYFFGVGSGHDVIDDQGRDDAIDVDGVVLGVPPSDVSVSRVGDNIVLTLTSGDTLTLTSFFNYYQSSLHPASAIERLVFSDGTQWDAARIASSARINGTAGDDVIEGMGGADTIVGGAGNDHLNGSSGDDLYIVRSGDGHDILDEGNSGGDDVVLFEDATAADVRVVLVTAATGPDYLRVERVDGTGSVTIGRNGRIETVRFSDGTSMDLDALAAIATVQGTSGAETLYGSNAVDRIFGHAGADVLRGEAGFDNYHWSRGDGNDVIIDYGNAAELGELQLHDIDPSLVVLTRVPTAYPGGGALYDLVVTIQPLLQTDVVETITIARFFSGDRTQGVTRIAFDGGVTWSEADLVMRSSLEGTSGDDLLRGTGLADRIVGGEGVDTLQGGSGSDTYVWAKGDGDDLLMDAGRHWDVDTLRLTDVAAEDVAFTRENDDLLIQILSTNEVIRVTDHFWVFDPNEEGNPDINEGVERIVFANGLEYDRARIISLLPPPEPEPEPGDGTEWQDYLSGTEGADRLRGFAEADNLSGLAGDDVLDGGTGADWMSGGEGADTYIYRAGDGDDYISDEGADDEVDHLSLEDVDLGDVTFSVDQTGLHLAIDGGGSIIVGASFAAELGYWTGGDDRLAVETFSFSDETVRTAREILNRALTANGATLQYGTSGADTLSGDLWRDSILGGAGDDDLSGDGGDDRLFGGDGADILTGGLGDDELVGGLGADTYVYALGDGDDRIINADWEGMGDVLQLTGGILAADVVVTRSGADAVLTFAGGGSITLQEQFSGFGVSTIAFASGPDWTLADIYARYLETAGTPDDDYIEASEGDDVLEGGAGNDELMGREGSDTYLFAPGDGDDIVYDYGSDPAFDQIVFAAGLDSTGVTVQRVDGSPDDILLVFATGESVRIAEALYLDPSESAGSGVEQITFGDNVVWTRADLYDAWLDAATTSGDDRIEGFSLYDDVLTGGAGADTFVFRRTFSDDVVTDFSLTDDVIELVDYTDFQAIMLNASQVGSDVVIDLGENGSITLAGIDLLDLTEAHFGLEPVGPEMAVAGPGGKTGWDDWDGPAELEPLVKPGAEERPLVRPLADDDYVDIGDEPLAPPNVLDDGVSDVGLLRRGGVASWSLDADNPLIVWGRYGIHLLQPDQSPEGRDAFDPWG